MRRNVWQDFSVTDSTGIHPYNVKYAALTQVGTFPYMEKTKNSIFSI